MIHTQALADLLAEDWEFRMNTDPLFATATGDNRFNDRLPDISESFFADFLKELHVLEKRLQDFDPASLSSGDRIDFEIHSQLLKNEIDLLTHKAYRMPISKSGGFHTYSPNMYLQMPMASGQDYENYISRLNAFNRYTMGHIEIMRAGIRDGQIPPRVTMVGVAESIRSQIVADPTQSKFYTPFDHIPDLFPASLSRHLKTAAASAIRDSVIPGYAALLHFITEEYLPACRETIAAQDLPQGREYYHLCIRHFTSLDQTPEEIHQIGMEEVKRIQAEMQAVIKEVGFSGNFQHFVKFLRTDPRFYAVTPQELLEKTSLVLKRMDGELPSLFKTLPRLPYGIRPIPEYAAPGCTAAYYQPGSGDGSRAGYYYVNTYDLQSRPLYEIEALSLHEAVPGHHLQLALQQELDLPNFRRFNGFTSFVEGWALYAERLGLERGFYTDPYNNFGRLSYEMWRACRLVVDTGIHALGWTRQQAIDFMLDHTSLTLLNITNEVDRYIAWPGQALAYKIGEIKIRQLRALAEKELKTRFDLREFHDVLLTSGALPLGMLESLVLDWVQKVK